jgi:hypothetical protein
MVAATVRLDRLFVGRKLDILHDTWYGLEDEVNTERPSLRGKGEDEARRVEGWATREMRGERDTMRERREMPVTHSDEGDGVQVSRIACMYSTIYHTNHTFNSEGR